MIEVKIIIKNKKAFERWFYLFLVIILLYSLFEIGDYLGDSYTNKQLQVELRNAYKEKKIPPPTETKEEKYLEEFIPLLQINEDIVGWISIANTNIDYPVVQAIDNIFYLEHNIDKKKSKSGSIFMDYRNSVKSKNKNTVIYGHNMKDGSMFKGLMAYKDPEFCQENSIIEFTTLYRSYHWEIFSTYITDTNFDYIKTDFLSEKEFEDFLKDIKDKSLYNTDIQVTKDDIILTLSTCSYEFNNARFVVHAKRII